MIEFVPINPTHNNSLLDRIKYAYYALTGKLYPMAQLYPEGLLIANSNDERWVRAEAIRSELHRIEIVNRDLEDQLHVALGRLERIKKVIQ